MEKEMAALVKENARLREENARLREVAERYERSVTSPPLRRRSLASPSVATEDEVTCTQATDRTEGIPIPGVRYASPWQDYGPPSQLSPSPLILRSKKQEMMDNYLLESTLAKKHRARAEAKPKVQKHAMGKENCDDGGGEAFQARGEELELKGGARENVEVGAPKAMQARDPREIFRGQLFLISGFSATETDVLVDRILNHGGSVAEKLAEIEDSHEVVVVAKERKRTLKVLFGLSAGRPIVRRQWVEESIQSGFPVELKRSLLVYSSLSGASSNEGDKKGMFEGDAFVLCGSRDFLRGDFKLVLERGGATVSTLDCDAPKKRRKREKFELGASKPTAVIAEDLRSIQGLQGQHKVIDYKVLTRAMEAGNVSKLFRR
uniref:BRCT domain-containing protein n=2 Tax=Chloropicon primus TaxID=1764295 RepID=A0A7S2WZS4_9CHLO|mmetsp:Transcript_3047/g.8270  ORF Transcript_3047/g.8270 Transcript_3047/m.8270 type:complete len:378 (+) Transcript_3047:279-1412(+)